MRVRISYSVDFKDVPLECARMLHDAALQMKEVREEISDLVKQLDDDKAQGWLAKDRIDRCRKKLAKLDAVLEDNDMILQGYFETKESHEEKSDVSEG
jgi:chromosome segregation ATPase